MRFNFCVVALALVGALTLMVSAYFYEIASALIGTVLAGAMTGAALLGFRGITMRLPTVGRWFVQGVAVVFALGIGIELFFSGGSGAERAITVGHFLLIILAALFVLARRTRDYALVIALTLLLMTAALAAGSGAILIPLVLLYMVLAGFTLMLYQMQRQAELVSASHFVGLALTREKHARARELVGRFWRELASSRFKFSCLWILMGGVLLAVGVFFTFPRLEAGSLLGRGEWGGHRGFTDELSLGGGGERRELRQIVARVKIRKEGREVNPETGPFYLRCLSLDGYQTNQTQPGAGGWFRSGYYAREMLPEVTATAESSLEQEVLLSDYGSGYLPGIYPLGRVEGGTFKKLAAQDRAAVAQTGEGMGNVCYRAYTLPEVRGARSFAWFCRQVKNLGGYWLYYARDLFIEETEILKMARAIAGDDLLRQRLPLQIEQFELFQKWLGLEGREPLPMPTTVDLGEQERPLLEELYRNGLRLERIDEAITRRIVSYLQEHHPYAPTPPPLPQAAVVGGTGAERVVYVDPIEDFLLHPGQAGNCEYFASAAARLARSLGLRMRLAAGYLADEYLPDNQYYLVRQSDAHVWVELYTAGKDWQRVEATPAAGQAAQETKTGILAGVSARLEKLQYKWMRYTADRNFGVRPGWARRISAWLEGMDGARRGRPPGWLRLIMLQWFTLGPEETGLALFGRWIIFFALLMNIAIGVRELLAWGMPRLESRRARRKTWRIYQSPTGGFYPRMLRMLSEVRLFKGVEKTPREFAVQVIGYDARLAPVGEISEAYYQVRYGGRPMGVQELEVIEAELVKLAAAVRALKKMPRRRWPWEKE